MSLSAAQAKAFFPEVARYGLVWTLRDDGGYPAPLSRSGQRAMPFWSSESRVRKIIQNVPAYAGFEPESTTLERWRSDWLPGLLKDGLLVGLNWYGEGATGFEYTPDEVFTWLARTAEDLGA